jgi:carboxymethylenebutenolidase
MYPTDFSREDAMNTQSTRFGIGIIFGGSIAEAVEKAKRAADVGFDVVMVGDHLGESAPLPTLVAIADAAPAIRISNLVINSPLNPEGLALVSKVGVRRDEAGHMIVWDDPDQLCAGIEENLATLEVEQLTAVNLRLIENAVPDARFIDQLGGLIAARDEGLIAGIGLSNITLAHLQRAVEATDIVCVQNSFGLADRSSWPVLAECVARDIAFVPFFPLRGWKTQREAILSNPVVTTIATRHDATQAQVALSWLLGIASNVLLNAGTTSRQPPRRKPRRRKPDPVRGRDRKPHRCIQTAMTDISIETPNGTIDAVFEIPSGEGPWPGVVVIHDAFGLREPHREIARRIADNGYLALAPNLFARGGMIRCMRTVFNDLMAYRGRTFDDISAARELLTERSDCTGAIGIAGFCMGGGFALVASTKGFGASAPFYPPPLQSKYAEIVDGACPIVASFGQRDPLNRGSGPHLEEVLVQKKIQHDVKTYPDVGHSFADHAPLQSISRIIGFGQNDDAANDAWQRVFAFFSEHLRV